MNATLPRLLLLSAVFLFNVCSHAAEPLRVFIRGGAANRGNDVHAHPRFLAEWKTLLAERGMKVDGNTDWPTAEHARQSRPTAEASKFDDTQPHLAIV
jgi:hypothetical protein